MKFILYTGSHYVFDILSRREQKKKKNSDTNRILQWQTSNAQHNIISITNACTTIAAGRRKLDIFK